MIAPSKQTAAYDLIKLLPTFWLGSPAKVDKGTGAIAVMGFVKYNGMTAEQFVWAWIKSEFLMPKKLMFNPDNLYYETLKTTIQNHEKGACPVAKKSKKAKRSKEVKNAENS